MINTLFKKQFTLLEEKENKDIGLFNGKTGLILLDTLYNAESNTFISPDEYLIYIHSNYTNLSFSSGITGIGWSIQTLLNNDLLSPHYNKILSEIDNYVYRETVKKKSFSLSLFSSNGLLGRTLYLYERVNADSHTIDSYYKNIAIKECLMLLISEICQIIPIILDKRQNLIQKNPAYYMELGQSFILIYLCFKSKIHYNYLQSFLQQFRLQLESYFDNDITFREDNQYYMFYLFYCYCFVAFDMQESSMINYCRFWNEKFILQIAPYFYKETDKHLLNIFTERIEVNNNYKALKNNHKEENFFLWDYLHLLSDKNINTKRVPYLRTFLFE